MSLIYILDFAMHEGPILLPDLELKCSDDFTSGGIGIFIPCC
jgi:hypothetical protein